MSTTVSTRKPGFPFHRLMRDGVYVAAFNLVCALFVTFFLSRGNYFWENLLISFCIGTSAFLIIDGVRLSVWGERNRPNWLQFGVLVVIAVPLAQFTGAKVAGWILGQSLASLYTLGNESTTTSLFITVLATGVATLVFSNRERILRAEAELAQERARTETVARQALQAQLQSLQAQIEPHMLFNTLANLQGLIAIDPPRAQEMLDLLIQYLRATLTSSRAETNTLAQEFELMKAYLGLMRIRMGERLSYSFDLPKELRGATVPPMLLQPLVENAISHGLEPKVSGGHVAVSAQLSGGALVLAVRDDGRGPDAGPGKKGTNLGLSNIRERLRAMYGERAALTLEAAAPEGAIARITLPA